MPRRAADPASTSRCPPHTAGPALTRHRTVRRRRAHRLRTEMFVRRYRIPTTAQILVLAMLRRGLVPPDELFAAACPSETELARCIVTGRPSPAVAKERPR